MANGTTRFIQATNIVVNVIYLRRLKEFALRVGIRLGRRLPLGLTKLFDQSGRLACTDHEPGIEFLIRFHGFAAVETRIRPAVDPLHTRRQGLLDIPQMIVDLLAAGPVAVAQFAPHVFSRLSDERQHRLIALLAFAFRVVALPPTHLLPKDAMHRRVGFGGDDFPLLVGRLPDPFAHGPRDGQDLARDVAVQRVYESPEGGLYRQLDDFEDARPDRVAGDPSRWAQARLH